MSDLIDGWANPGFSVHREFIRAIVRAAPRSQGPILECGTGLSTLLLGVAVQRNRTPIWALENSDEWTSRICRELARHRIEGIELCTSELTSYGTYTWYAPPLDRMPSEFSLVVCDGPPHFTPGGRYGLLPVMRARLAPGCLILMDDIERADEQRIVEQWGSEFGANVEVRGHDKPYAAIRLP